MAQTKHQKLARELLLLAQKSRKKNFSIQLELPTLNQVVIGIIQTIF
ncbi:unknown protein [Parachlamydia acanthamoebae UV-7]|uniref:Uncharacterized protein n=2 Tax=Parachlamydia acanthamoebae TaxID=83552 RepID=F8L1K1_PARAV|nr:hypothetical protein DB43_GT00320 [Parachlamydia acanthamoebae]CCB87143.1 unknown protein [Parachlamydia acanthamoebae UV-7]